MPTFGESVCGCADRWYLSVLFHVSFRTHLSCSTPALSVLHFLHAPPPLQGGIALHFFPLRLAGEARCYSLMVRAARRPDVFMPCVCRLDETLNHLLLYPHHHGHRRGYVATLSLSFLALRNPLFCCCPVGFSFVYSVAYAVSLLYAIDAPPCPPYLPLPDPPPSYLCRRPTLLSTHVFFFSVFACCPFFYPNDVEREAVNTFYHTKLLFLTRRKCRAGFLSSSFTFPSPPLPLASLPHYTMDVLYSVLLCFPSLHLVFRAQQPSPGLHTTTRHLLLGASATEGTRVLASRRVWRIMRVHLCVSSRSSFDPPSFRLRFFHSPPPLAEEVGQIRHNKATARSCGSPSGRGSPAQCLKRTNAADATNVCANCPAKRVLVVRQRCFGHRQVSAPTVQL